MASKKKSLISDKEQKFIHFYLEQTWEEMRHLENLRERISAIIITLSLAISGFIIQQKFALETKALTWFIILLGMFGLLVIRKIYQIHQRCQQRLDEWYLLLEETFGHKPQVFKIRNNADQKNKEKFRIISKIPHNFFWSVIHVFTIASGVYFLLQNPISERDENCTMNTTTVIVNRDNPDSKNDTTKVSKKEQTDLHK